MFIFHHLYTKCSTYSEAYQRHYVGYLIECFVMVHDICRELRHTGIAHYSHHKEGRATLGLVAKTFEGE